ncbi:MAG: DUF2085 domain-containing protein [Acidobacteriota bacterium]|nr:DUF2085 domain-containing protein [Acidobacteriota bacterium]
MKQTIENYVPQIAVETIRRRAFFVWSVAAVLIAVWVFLILLAPFAEAQDFSSVSHPIYKFFSFICHQIPARSFYLENHAFAVCARCFGVYCGLLIGFITYPIFRPIETVEPFPRPWLFLAMIPMAVDWSLGVLNIWENTHWSRFSTGFILGAACAVFIVPAIVEIAQVSSNRGKRRSR